MKNHEVRVYRSEENLPREDQLAWKLAEVAVGRVVAGSPVARTSSPVWMSATRGRRRTGCRCYRAQPPRQRTGGLHAAVQRPARIGLVFRIERLLGGAERHRLLGDRRELQCHDTLRGGGDRDTLSGGDGNDRLDGDAGNDTYVYASTADSSQAAGRPMSQ